MPEEVNPSGGLVIVATAVAEVVKGPGETAPDREEEESDR